MITTLLELCFATTDLGARLDLSGLGEDDTIKMLFSENAGIVFQSKDDSIEAALSEANIDFKKIGNVVSEGTLTIKNGGMEMGLNITSLRDTWFKTSYLLDNKQTANGLAKDRFENYKEYALKYIFPKNFTGKNSFPLGEGRDGAPKAAILREKGSNSEREMANAMYLACLLYTSSSPRDRTRSRMPSSA